MAEMDIYLLATTLIAVVGLLFIKIARLRRNTVGKRL
jgi:hypothetical protein